MKKALIIDDEPLARKIVREYAKDLKIEIVGECGDGFEGVKLIEQLNPDIVFLDIQMPKINGFEMLELISQNPSVIFSTAYDEFALKAFEVNAVDYLLKPYTKERFNKAVEKALLKEDSKVEQINNSIDQQTDRIDKIVIKDGTEIKILPLDEVSHIEAYDDYVKIYVGTKYHLKKKTMNFYEKTLKDEQFVRIHRSYLLNIQHLTKIESFEKNSYVAIVKSGERLPISRSNYAELKHKLGL